MRAPPAGARMRRVNAEPGLTQAVTPAPVPRARRLAVPAGMLAAVAGAFAYVGTVDPNEPGHYPVCPLLRYTGLYCPGCGGLRSAHAFAHGDCAAALRDNALAVARLLGFAVLWTVWVVRAARGRPDARRPRRRAAVERSARCCWSSRLSGTCRSAAGYTLDQHGECPGSGTGVNRM